MSTPDRPFFYSNPQSCQPPLGLVVEEEIRFNWARLIDDRRNVAYFYDLSFQQAGESRFLVATTLNQSFLASNQPSSRVSCDKMNEWRDWAVSLWSLWRNANNQIKCWKFVISRICLRLAELKMSRRLLLIDDRHRFFAITNNVLLIRHHHRSMSRLWTFCRGGLPDFITFTTRPMTFSIESR